jgi:HSP20 family protein
MVWRGFTHPWEPWRALNERDEEMDRLFMNTYGGGLHEYPPVNVWTGDDGALVIAEVPGIGASELEVTVVNDTLTLKGSRAADHLQEGDRYHRRERGFGNFTRSLRLPFRIAQEAVEASVRCGVARVRLPRAADDRPRRIVVQGG